jgi:nucleoid-associated protein YgaU
MAKSGDYLIYGGLALVGLGGYLYLQGQQPAAKPAPAPQPTPAPTPAPVPPSSPCARQYQVLGGDTLWGIATRFYGNGAAYPQIYGANATLIESTAIAHGFASSEAGHWIFPGQILCIP